MPKIDTTSVSSPSLGGAGHIAAGVQDTASSFLISKVGEAAIAGYKGYQTAQIEDATESVIQEYADRRDPTNLAAQAASLDKEQQSLFSSGTSEAKLDPVRKEFNNLTTRYENALKQGTMSASEFSDRILDITRQYYNKNPAIAQELVAHSQKVLELSGINTMINADAEAAKAKQAESKDLSTYYMGLAKDFKINLPLTQSGAINMPQLIQDVNFIQRQQHILELAQRQTSFDEESFRQFGAEFGNAKVYEAINQATLVLEDPNIPYDKQIFQINNILDSVEKSFSTDPRIAKILDKPAVQATQKFIQTQIGAMRDNMRKFASKEEAAAYSTNMLNLLKNNQYQTISQTVNPQALDVYSKLVTNTHLANMIGERPDLMVSFFNQTSRIIDGLATDGTTIYTKDKRGNTGAEVILRDLVQGLGGPKANEKDILATSNMLKSLALDTEGMNPQEQMAVRDKAVKVLSEPTSLEGLKKLDDAGKSVAMTEVNKYVDSLMPELISNINQYNKQGKNVTLDVLPNGNLVVSSSDPTVTTELSRRYIQRVNNSMKSIANLGYEGNTTSATTPFYQRLGKYFNVTEVDNGTGTNP